MKTISISILLALLVGITHQVFAFCGFYVAKADATLFNKASEVIIARDGSQTVITMSSDFQGDVKDFAMVVPVPEVLTKDRIRVADRGIFDRLDAYSGPRLVEYHDNNPCMQQRYYMDAVKSEMAMPEMVEEDMKDDFTAPSLGVTIVEKYTVGEYDILILSAEESGGLEKWLTMNGYKIPSGAAEVLEPYIKDNLKFFVVKVNMKAFENSGFQTLRPIQMTFKSDRFGLPIRLGMANANGDQDLIVYAFTQKGRVETANYRTVEIPTDRNIPEFVQTEFGDFYKALFDRSHSREKERSVFVEYAWNLSSNNFMKCDPCPTTPPAYADLRESGVFWLGDGANKQWGGSDYQGDVFMTRLHVRYNRKTFPQDLAFVATPNNANFQGRYIITHPAQGDLSCDQGQSYLKDLVSRRQKELDQLSLLTGWSTYFDRDTYIAPYRKQLEPKFQPYLNRLPDDDKGVVWMIPGAGNGPGNGPLIFWVFLAGISLLLAGAITILLRKLMAG
jgi:hypothetical protein